ncbi:MAG: galactokinase [Candidatus Promineifilaceae bacterium]|nr:galactokinase [Candidatus Promineifilaceae bacterium]
MNEREEYISDEFRERFGREPSVWTRAPGRVDLMGSHTDYNMGYVMTMSIDRDTWIAAAPRKDSQVSIYSTNIPGGATFSVHDEIAYDEELSWTNYMRGVAAVLRAEGYTLPGFDGLVHSTIPFGSGLSSSAAIEMATVQLFSHLGDLELDPVQMALIGQKAENNFVGVNTGILDQYSSVNGEDGCTLLLDCRHLSHEIVAMPPGIQVVICNTRAERNLTGTEYDERRAQCEEGVRLLQKYDPDVTALRDVSPVMFAQHRQALPEIIARRCQFIIEENQRVLDLAEVLPQGDPGTLKRLFTESYQGARDLYEIGAPAMAAMMKAMSSAPGVVAARQAGAGFGGSMVALVKNGFQEPFAAHVADAYERETGIPPEVYPVKAAPGAMVMR